MSSDKVRVAIRVRPFNTREKELQSQACFEINGPMTTLTDPNSGRKKSYTFDYSYNSFLNKVDPEYASQETVWGDLGVSVLDSAWEGIAPYWLPAGMIA